MAASFPSGFPRPLQGTLALYKASPSSLPYFDTDPSLPNCVVFIPGLTDTIGVVPYLPRLVDALAPLSYSLVQPQLTCNMGGYGACSLEGDAQEIAACVEHLRTKGGKSGRIVLMGHSTGCQDCIAYLLSQARAASPSTRIDAAILQAPVSDREDYEFRRSQQPEQQQHEWDQKMSLAKKLIDEGKGAEMIPRLERNARPNDRMPPTVPANDDASSECEGNWVASLSAPLTAYRHYSLFAKDGDDDFFSSDLDDSRIVSTETGARTIGLALKNIQAGSASAKILAVMGEKE